MADTLTIWIDDEGTIHTQTDAVSGANHSNAEQFLRYVATLAGGETTRQRRADVHTHTHTHSHEHEHSHE
jgi:hypothetical protein